MAIEETRRICHAHGVTRELAFVSDRRESVRNGESQGSFSLMAAVYSSLLLPCLISLSPPKASERGGFAP